MHLAGILSMPSCPILILRKADGRRQCRSGKVIAEYRWISANFKNSSSFSQFPHLFSQNFPIINVTALPLQQIHPAVIKFSIHFRLGTVYPFYQAHAGSSVWVNEMSREDEYDFLFKGNNREKPGGQTQCYHGHMPAFMSEWY